MPHDRIQAEVDQLRAHVRESSELPAEDKAGLDDLASRLDQMISGQVARPEQDLVEALEAKLFAYEEAHPLVARIIDNVLVILNGMGI